MTRISSSMINSSALQNLQRAQSDMYEAQRQTASQTKADDLKGYGRDAKSLVTLERLRARTDSHLETAKELNIRLSIQDAQLGRATETISTLKEKLTTALSLDDLTQVDSMLRDAFNDLKSSFNTTHNGNYLFSGTRSDTAPIRADSIEDLAANPLTAAVLQNGDAVQVRIDDSRVVQAAPLAQTAAPDALSVLRDLKIFQDSAGGPFNATPDANQKQAIQDAISKLGGVFDGLLSTQAENGRAMNETDAMIERQQGKSDLLSSLSANITEVDLAQVAVELNQAQLQYQATASVFNTIQGLSLVDYLR